jgi:hypothetical protein
MIGFFSARTSAKLTMVHLINRVKGRKKNEGMEKKMVGSEGF